MKKTAVVGILIIMFCATQALAIDASAGWKTDYAEAKKAAADENKLILAYFWFTG